MYFVENCRWFILLLVLFLSLCFVCLNLILKVNFLIGEYNRLVLKFWFVFVGFIDIVNKLVLLLVEKNEYRKVECYWLF